MNVFELNRYIWQTRVERKPDGPMVEKLNRILWKQTGEIDDLLGDCFHPYAWVDYEHISREFADSLLIAARGMEACGYDPEQKSIERLLTRHLGKTKEITAKYATV